MKLLINTASTYKGGGVQVARSFLDECREFTENEYHVVLGQMLSTLIDRKKFPQNFSFYTIGFRPATRVFSLKKRDNYFRQLEHEIKPDVVFTTSGPAYWRPIVPHLTGYNLPHYIYRSSPFFDRLTVAERLKWDLKGQIIKYFFKNDSDAYVVQTNDVNHRLRKWLSTDNVHTVTNTCSSDYRQPKIVKNKLEEKGVKEFRFLTLSSWYPHKNIDIIPELINNLSPELKETVKFVLTLPEEVFREKIAEIYRDSVINVGPVKPDEGPSLYRECDALFLPTLLECFSASYAEAMAMERPILTTDMGFAKSICADAALYFQPTNPEDAAKKVTQIVQNTKLRNQLVSAGNLQLKTFDTPRERAGKYLSICESMV